MLTSAAFKRLVAALKQSKKTCTVVEQCCGGLINASIMAQPGASAVFYGGSVSYNTRKAKPLLLNDDELHAALTAAPLKESPTETDADIYINSKIFWTSQTSVAFCEALETDYCIAEGGAAGPTFRPDGLDSGFAALAVAGRGPDGAVRVLGQKVVRSSHANREANMRLFADAAADFGTEFIGSEPQRLKDINEQSGPQPAAALMLDRATKLRSDTEALEALKPRAKYILLRGNEVLVRSSTEPAILTYDEICSLGGSKEATFLGILSDDNKTPMFSIDLLEEEQDDATRFLDGAIFVDTRTSAPLFPQLENELVLHATALAQWQSRSSFCMLCGGKTILVDAGTCRRCTSCGTPSWPRQDPSIIAVVSSRDGQRVLLARSKRHPPKLHTVLAGFVEAGETFEAAVARETFEETGVRIDEGSVEYVGSQPWPFPQSCMIGFAAVADDTQPLDLDTDEIVEAGWFEKSHVKAAAAVEGATMQHAVAEAALEADPTLPLLIPPKGVIARKLLDTWLDKAPS